MHLPFLMEWDPFSAAALRRSAAAAAARGFVPMLHAHTAHAAAVASLAARAGGPAYVAHRRVDFPASSGLSARLKYGPAHAVIAVSGYVAHILSKDGVSHLKIRVVPDAVPFGAAEAKLAGAAELLPPAPSERAVLRSTLCPEAPAGALWIGNLAALVPHKDHETLLKAFAQVRAARADARLFILGQGPLRGRLEALARSMKLQDAVRFLGYVERAHDWMRAFDVYAHSSWGEGMGSVLLEAMAAGVPIAATSAGGIPEVVESERSALLSPPRDPKVLAQNALRLAGDEALRRKLSEAGRARLEAFSVAKLGERTLQAYALAAGFHGSAPRELAEARA
ncbi:MAG: glycosyltransferase [Elusimicrobia bacterium]|nr:glycosyltransferase [Elusimicrobiota bacterium]